MAREDAAGGGHVDRVKEILIGQITAELVRAEMMFPVYPTDVIHAAAIVAEEAGELVRAANNVYHYDSVEHRENLLGEAIQVTASGLRFLMEIGNLKSKYDVL
jgi:hypothetical protein